MLLYALTAAREGVAKADPADETVIDGKSIVELTLKLSDDDSLLELGDHAYYTKPSAHLVLECLMNGVHVLHNVDDRVVLRWGDWVKSDFT
ncbi:hypothetical protein [Methylobacterium brachiatum]|uniref:hypothetical protein n=1 Tax=Methylobacterium brachiatum TaxID=269660 RepID=UPI0008DEAC06|nr:hypothetical protein [Methylobacterium brachiatum]SFI50956.1 hypothetical protein SAMN02799642_02042 [Methylobacterium brachiatum]